MKKNNTIQSSDDNCVVVLCTHFFRPTYTPNSICMTRLTTNSSNDVDVSAEDPFSAERTWITLHCARKGNDFYCRVPDEFVEDNFNLTGLNEVVPNYEHAVAHLLGRKFRQTSHERMTRAVPSLDTIERSAERLYGLVHARYAMTADGIATVRAKYLKRAYGGCPRVFCNGAHVLPIGLTDKTDEATVKVFCPRCNDVYVPRSTRDHQLDGAFFGTGLPHMLFMVHPELRPPPVTEEFDARLFGFRLRDFEVHKHSQDRGLKK